MHRAGVPPHGYENRVDDPVTGRPARMAQRERCTIPMSL
jgi:hypothetical protein